MRFLSLLGATLKDFLPYIIIAAVILVVVIAIAISSKKRKAKSNAKKQPKQPAQTAQPKAVPQPFKPEIITPPATSHIVTATPAPVEDVPPIQEPTVAQHPTVVETEKQGVIIIGDHEVLVRYNRSFVSKLMQTTDEVKGYYAELVNHALGYHKVKNRVSWPCSTINCSREKLAIILVKGKTLYLYLALDTALARQTIKGTLKDVSAKKRFQAVPTLFKVKSTLSLRKAKLLIDTMMNAKGIAVGKPSTAVSAGDFPYETTEELIRAGHIKVRALDGSEIDETKTLRTAGFGIVKSVTAEQAHNMIADEVASTLVQTSADKVGARAGKKFAVNIDTLSQKFENGEVVTLDVLKEKGIVPKKETAIKILARGTLDKALTVEADAFSLDAVKMIVLVGGTAIRK